MKKKIVIIVAIVLVLIVAVVGFFMYMSSQPMYKVGNVQKGINLSAPLEPPAQKKDSAYFTVEEGIELYHFTEGTGRNVLVVHGGPGMPYSHAWSGLEGLTDDYRFVYYDQRGCGDSTRPIDTFESNNFYNNTIELETKLGLTAQIADIERIRQILGEDKLIVIGHSFGGFIASLYATEFPEHVEKLILVAPAPLLKMPMETDDLFANLRNELPEEVLEDYDALVERYFDYQNIFSNSDEDLIQLNNELGYYFGLAFADTDSMAPNNKKAGGWMIQAAYFSMGMQHDYTKDVPVFDFPSLIVHPGNDFVQTEEASRTYYDILPDAEFVIIDDAGHAVFEDKPEIFGKAVSDFIEEN